MFGEKLGDLKIGDRLVLHNHGEISWNGEGTGSEGGYWEIFWVMEILKRAVRRIWIIGVLRNQ